MSGWNYYLLSKLPWPAVLGAAPPLSVSEFLEVIKENRNALRLCRALALGEDLLAREALLSGERRKMKFFILQQQKDGHVGLPHFLKSGIQELPEGDQLNEFEKIRCAYFEYLVQTARQCGSTFLVTWVGYELALRNALATARAEVLGWKEKPPVLQRDLADDCYDFSSLVNDWKQAATPLKGWKLIERARWAWLMKNDHWFSFSDDEIVVYFMKLLVLWHWYKLVETQDLPAGSSAAKQ